MKVIIDELNDEAVLSLNPLEYQVLKAIFRKKEGLIFERWYKNYLKSEDVKKRILKMTEDLNKAGDFLPF